MAYVPSLPSCWEITYLDTFSGSAKLAVSKISSPIQEFTADAYGKSIGCKQQDKSKCKPVPSVPGKIKTKPSKPQAPKPKNAKPKDPKPKDPSQRTPSQRTPSQRIVSQRIRSQRTRSPNLTRLLTRVFSLH